MHSELSGNTVSDITMLPARLKRRYLPIISPFDAGMQQARDNYNYLDLFTHLLN